MYTKYNFETKNKPILVTGSHRSGSTWVGKMISQSPLVGYKGNLYEEKFWGLTKSFIVYGNS